MTFAVITGPSRGIGRATALALAKRKCRLALVGRPSPGFTRTAHDARKEGCEVLELVCDFQNLAEIEPKAEALLQFGGPPDAVIFNAGALKRGLVSELSLEDWQSQLDVNLTAPFVLTRALLPSMLARKSGRLVYVSSISATLGTPRAAAYVASKWALTGFVKSLAAELTDTGLMATAILPGSVDTDMLKPTGFEPRMTADDVAKTLVFCALDAPLAHNGSLIEMFGV